MDLVSKSPPGIRQALAQWCVDSKDPCLLGAQLSSEDKTWTLHCGRWERVKGKLPGGGGALGWFLKVGLGVPCQPGDK